MPLKDIFKSVNWIGSTQRRLSKLWASRSKCYVEVGSYSIIEMFPNTKASLQISNGRAGLELFKRGLRPTVSSFSMGSRYHMSAPTHVIPKGLHTESVITNETRHWASPHSFSRPIMTLTRMSMDVCKLRDAWRYTLKGTYRMIVMHSTLFLVSSILSTKTSPEVTSRGLLCTLDFGCP